VQRLADQVVGDVGAVELRGVDVVDAELHGAAQDRTRAFGVARRAEDAGAGELHGAVADPSYRELAESSCVVGHAPSLR
jgi:site-specific DNA-cytosine methylase